MHSLVEGSGGNGLEEAVGQLGLLVHQLVRVEDYPANSRPAGLQG